MNRPVVSFGKGAGGKMTSLPTTLEDLEKLKAELSNCRQQNKVFRELVQDTVTVVTEEYLSDRYPLLLRRMKITLGEES